jgi:hypothetical protein
MSVFELLDEKLSIQSLIGEPKKRENKTQGRLLKMTVRIVGSQGRQGKARHRKDLLAVPPQYGRIRTSKMWRNWN